MKDIFKPQRLMSIARFALHLQHLSSSKFKVGLLVVCFFGRLFFTFHFQSNAEDKRIKLQSWATTQNEDFCISSLNHGVVFNFLSIAIAIY